MIEAEYQMMDIISLIGILIRFTLLNFQRKSIFNTDTIKIGLGFVKDRNC